MGGIAAICVGPEKNRPDPVLPLDPAARRDPSSPEKAH